MRAVIQRVSSAKVVVDGETVGEIGRGLLVFLGVSSDDVESDLEYMVNKTIGLRIFEDDNEKMNLSLLDVKGEMLVVSQFTICGDARKGRRPTFTYAAPPDKGEAMYERFIAMAKERGVRTASGRFGAMMKVELANDGPVTILADSKKTF